MDYTTHVTLLTRLAEDLDPAAWREFHDRYIDLIRGVARRYGLQSADCEDVAQEVLMDLSRSVKDFEYDPSRGKFRSFLKTITLRKIFRVLRQRRGPPLQEDREEPEASPAVDSGLEAAWEEEWRRHHVRRAMTRLEHEFSERDRLAFSLYAVIGRPVGETAEVLDMSRDLVYQVKSRILKRLSAMIAEQVEDEG